MAKYLDYSGLQYLWTKIKNYVSTQPLGANVRYDAQTLTTAQQEQARKNIMAGGSNRNLLDNPWFIINQRGATSGGNGTYPADRWGVSYGTGGVEWSRNADGSIAVTPNNLTSHGDLTQKIDSDVFPFLANKTITASVMLANGEIYSGSTVVSTSTTKTPIYVEIDDKILQVNIYVNGTFSIQSWRGTLSIKAAKLEFGSVSTFANDTPPDYGTELANCIYSTADPTDTYANNGFGRSNRNLLDNPWFTVRQRGAGPFTGTSIHSADRWKSTGGNPTVNLLSPYGIQIVNTTNSNVDQYLSYTKEDLDGKTVTLSVLSDDGITSGTGTFDASSNSYTITFTFGSGKWYCRFGYFSSVHARPFIRIANVTVNESTSVNIYAIKLELGSVSTLANDTTPDYPTELAKCQYYFKRFSPTAYSVLWSGIAVNTTQGAFFVNGEMRSGVNPTITISGTGYIEQGTSMKLITIGQGYYTRQGTRLILTTSATLTSNTECCVYTSANQNFVVDISAEL